MRASLVMVFGGLAAIWMICAGCETQDVSDATLLASQNGSAGGSNTNNSSSNGVPVIPVTSNSTAVASTGKVENVQTEVVATGVTTYTQYSGHFSKAPPIKAGSVTIVAGAGANTSYTFVDNGAGVLSATSAGKAIGSGSVNYNTGAWSISLYDVDIPTGTQIVAYYTYYTN